MPSRFTTTIFRDALNLSGLNTKTTTGPPRGPRPTELTRRKAPLAVISPLAGSESESARACSEVARVGVSHWQLDASRGAVCGGTGTAWGMGAHGRWWFAGSAGGPRAMPRPSELEGGFKLSGAPGPSPLGAPGRHAGKAPVARAHRHLASRRPHPAAVAGNLGGGGATGVCTRCALGATSRTQQTGQLSLSYPWLELEPAFPPGEREAFPLPVSCPF